MLVWASFSTPRSAASGYSSNAWSKVRRRSEWTAISFSKCGVLEGK
jgi:hypothetical protein